jgi:two-component system, NarL family, response regulator NreC
MQEHALTIVIADDDSEFRGIARRMLEGEPQSRVIGEIGDGEGALRLVRTLHPDVVLMDITMPRMNGLEAIRLAKNELPATKIIVVTVHVEEAYRRAALASGADGFITKKSLHSELWPTIRRVVFG